MNFFLMLMLVRLVEGNMETLDFFKKHSSHHGTVTTPDYVKNLKLKLEDLERRLRSVEQPGMIIKFHVKVILILATGNPFR